MPDSNNYKSAKRFDSNSTLTIRSMKRCESTDMRLTISPTVLVRLAALVIRKACKKTQF